MTEFLLQAATTTTLILLLLFNTTPTTSAAGDHHTPVLDSRGNPLEAGSRYYMTTVARGLIHGFRAKSKTNQSRCPQFVYITRGGDDFGSPVSFFPADPKQKNITLSSDLNIVFRGLSICRSQRVGQLISDAETGGIFESTGGRIGNPGPETIPNWFKIEPNRGRSYYLRFCPGFSPGAGSAVVCGNLTVIQHEPGVGWFGLSFNPIMWPIEISFLKA